MLIYIYGIYPVCTKLIDYLKQKSYTTKFFDIHNIRDNSSEVIEIASDVVILYMNQINDRASDVKQSRSSLLNAAWRRIWNGFAISYILHQSWMKDILEICTNSDNFSPHQKMLKLIKNKSSYAFGYHVKKTIEGKSIDEWFNPKSSNPEAFIQAFAKSPYIKPGDPEKSILFKHLVSFKGPMFRVFSEKELEIISEWIKSLKAPVSFENTKPAKSKDNFITTNILEDSSQDILDSASSSKGFENFRGKEFKSSKPNFESLENSLRDFYYYLLHIEFFPELLPRAKRFAQSWLNCAEIGIYKGDRAIPYKTYSHESFEKWLNEQHKRQVASYINYSKNQYNPDENLQPTKKELIDSSIQLCPLIFIDGAWVQKMGNLGICRTELGARLYHIYVDEVGNGDIKLNHPNIYRELMKQMKVELPEFGSLEFCKWKGFKESSFEVPVFWLCISQFPKYFLPEILGLNLAMELSGVGGTYRIASARLKQYGFSTHFVDLHNSIDNISTGHTAWALEAIKLYMDDMLKIGGRELVQREWKRIWTGYRSLKPITPGLLSLFNNIIKEKILYLFNYFNHKLAFKRG